MTTRPLGPGPAAERPLVCLLERNNLFGWPPTFRPDGTPNIPEGAESVAYLELAEALRCDLDSDLHFVQYGVPDLRTQYGGPHRVIAGAPERLAGVENEGLTLSSSRGVPVNLLIAEVDCPKPMRHAGMASDDWWALERLKVERLQAEQPGVLAYRSRGGYRLLAWLPEPHLVVDAESARQWRELYLLLVADLHARYQIRADPKCSEWQRLQRAPLALRAVGEELVREPGEFVGDPDAVGEWDLTLLDPERAVAAARLLGAGSKAWAQAVTFLEAPLPGAARVTTDPSTPPVPRAPDPSDAVLDALLPAVAAVGVNGSRHDMYMALCGTLLDRGFPADDLPQLARDLSERAGVDEPRLVADRVKTAQSTIARLASGALYVRIGSLQGRWPEVAAAVDRAVPARRPSGLSGLLRAFCRPAADEGEHEPLPGLIQGSDLEVARIAVARLEAEGGRIVHDLDTFWVCPPGEGVWRPDGRYVIEEVVHRLDGVPVGRESFKVNSSRVGGVLDLAATLVRSPNFFSNAPIGAAFQNGFLRLLPDGSVVLEPPSASHRAIELLPFAYDAAAPCPLWLHTMAGVFRGDEDAAQKIALLQEYVGCSLLGAVTRWQTCVVLEGPHGNNGKSTILKVLGRLVSNRARASMPPQKWTNEYYVAHLAGALLNLVAEMPRTDIATTEEFKGVVAGDEQTGRHPKGQPFKFHPRAGHIFNCNGLPGTSDQSDAYWRRFLVLTFNRVFRRDEMIADLAEQIIAGELPGVVAWAIAGARRALAGGGLTNPPSSERRKAEWRMASDQVALWVRERLEGAPGEATHADRVYKCFKDWAADNGHRGMSSQKFEERLTQLGYVLRRNGHAEWADVRVRQPAGTAMARSITERPSAH